MCGVSPYPTQPLFALPLYHWVPLQTLPTVGRLLPPHSFVKTIFLWLPDRTEDRSGLVGKIITFWQTIGSRVFERGGNDGFGGFLRLNSILEKNSKTSFRDRWDRSLQTERTGPLRYTLEHFVTLASQTYLCALVAACTPPHTMHKPHTHTQTLLPMSSWVFQRCMMGGMHH